MSELRARYEKRGREDHWTVAELSAYLGVSQATLKRWEKIGKIPHPAERSSSGWALWSPEQMREIRRVVFRG